MKLSIIGGILSVALGLVFVRAQPLLIKVSPELFSPGDIQIITPHSSNEEAPPLKNAVVTQNASLQSQAGQLNADGFVEVLLLRQLQGGEELVSQFFSTGPTDVGKTREFLKGVLKSMLTVKRPH